MLRKLPGEFQPTFRYSVLNGMAANAEVVDRTLWNEKQVVYARVADHQTIYIGSTDRLLRKRITEHLKLIQDQRNVRYRQWAEGKLITVFAYKPPLIRILGRDVAIHRALEAALIGEATTTGIDPSAWFVKRA